MATRRHHRIVIIGAGSAGVSVAARLRRAGERDVAVLDPSLRHHYQPLWTLVGGGRAPLEESVRPQDSVMPRGVRWIRRAARAVDPGAREVALDDGGTVSYDQLVVCPGIQLDWDRVPGLEAGLGEDGLSSNYLARTAPATWRFIRRTRSGTAVFGMPSGAIKCGGAPQKIAYLAADYWREQGLLGRIDVHLVLPGAAVFGVPEFARVLEGVIRRYGIHVHYGSEVTEVRPEAREVTVTDLGTGSTSTLPYDMAHLVPPQSAPDWIKRGPLAASGDPAGYVEVDRHTLRHVRYPDVWALGDAASSPNAKTGAAVRKQAPVVVENLLAALDGREPTASYGGYSSCPLTTARTKMLLAEFDYSGRPAPSIPVIDTVRERTDMWYLKRRGLPFLYWNLMLRGLA
ncbi:MULTISPECIES: NAD(P)/FAD-dependent oxidoreductase [Streptomyces]|uniref:Sulfide dehydrogenase [flavocytochrome c] flavoprotein chain n=2 Tax=Streptomyces TaxID=1883 RepID=A0A1D8G908_9ACTN|nr:MULTISPECIES: FAD/NAD(P)-binding oxidoreductase [Streptomyces]AOT61922.1 Sulfide dehydrogenase [flavocytochrome c] flavoprotein chain precursor [Streptomyces rubrolavendulae]KAF0649906.1 FAD-dependent pyridine nucleotide-disulfide oxidoreductase [Streptomyces fradiae ATCC 10745 = DSM 40063]OSY49560.1 Sulfide dehydrogenase [flavocytochrome c] flavoprotein chain precursor [Streptomyces fradiae ATCC 10745 = DSM 40063]